MSSDQTPAPQGGAARYELAEGFPPAKPIPARARKAAVKALQAERRTGVSSTDFLDKLLALLVCGRLFKNCGTVSRKFITDTAELSLQPVIDFVIHARSPFIEFRHIL